MTPLKNLGMGTYRMVANNPAHRVCLYNAISQGMFSVIDTSPNYNDGAAETLVGSVLAELGDQAKCRVISKFGFIQGAALEEHRKKPFPGAVQYTEDCSHSIHPDFMRSQLELSLGRLGRRKLDTYLVHNPEHFLISQIPPDTKDGGFGLVEGCRTELLRMMKDTFVALEEEVKVGRIGTYGVSSNSFALPDDHPHFVPFDGLVDLAQSAAETVGNPVHSFSTFQLPGNVIERTGLCPVEAGGNGCAQFAKANNIEVIVNRVLTAFDEVGSWRLADAPFPLDYAKARDELLEHLTPEDVSEDALSPDELKEWRETLEASLWLRQLVNDLDAQMSSFCSVMHYQDDLMRKIIPLINSKLDGMDEVTSDLLFLFFSKYERAIRSVAGEQTRTHVFENLSQDEKLTSFDSEQDDFVPPPMPQLLNVPDREPLEKYAIGWLQSHPCISTILVGAIRPEYVAELNSMEWQETP